MKVCVFFNMMMMIATVSSASSSSSNSWDPNIANCPSFPRHKAASVADLRPSSLNVVAALGDSITAGFGIKGIEGLLDEYRGLSGMIGGDDKAITMANFLKHFNGDIQGASVGKHLVETPSDHYRYHPKEDRLNAAQSGAQSTQLVQEVQYLIEQMKENPQIDFENDWKLLSVLIGANDGCRICRKNGVYLNVTAMGVRFNDNLNDALELVRKEIPRVVVNLLPMLTNMTNLWRINQKHWWCKEIHKKLLLQECGCAFYGGANEHDTLVFDQAMNTFADAVESTAHWYRQNANNNTFAVIIQPFFRYINFPNIKFLSTLDCFHPSLLAHQQVAVAGWNSMFRPYAQKPRNFTVDEPLYCPKQTDKIWVT